MPPTNSMIVSSFNASRLTPLRASAVATLEAAGEDYERAATAEEEVAAAEAENLEDAIGAALFAETPVSRGASSSAAGPFSPRPPSAGPSSSGANASSAATAEARSGVNLLALKLEAITMLYGSRERGHYYEDLQQAYTVNWAAELGQ